MEKLKSAVAASVMVATLGVSLPAAASEPFIGQIQYFGFSFTPRGWAACDGQLLPVSSNSALFSLIGTTYGGDGRTTFALPDMRGRVPVHMGAGPGLSSYRIGDKGGAERVTLTAAQLPSHTHAATLHGNSTVGNAGAPANTTVLAAVDRGTNYTTAAPNVTMSPSSVTIENTGGSQPVEIRQPYLTVNCQIALIGLYPSRQ
jgi:microcystin-dependent protein